MKRAFFFLFTFVLSLSANSSRAQDGASMWGCAPAGERRNVLYLSDQGSRSYIKFADQRVPATVSSDDQSDAGGSDVVILKKWSWGENSITLDSDGIARYLEGGTIKAQFRCKARS